MGTEINVSILCGGVVVDRHLGLHVTDDEFCRFVGDAHVSNLAMCAHPEDVKRLSEAIKKATLEEPVFICYRVKTADGSYHYVLAKFFYDSAKTFKAGLLQGHYVELDNLSERMNQTLFYTYRLETYLDLLGAILFEMDKDTGHLLMYTGSSQNRNVIFDGTFKHWQEICKGMPLTEEGKAAVKRVLTAMKETKGEFSDDVVFQAEPKDVPVGFPEYFIGKTIRVKGRHYDDGVGARIQGYLFAVRDANVSSFGILDNSMDPALNIYNKKSITEFAKRRINRGKVGYLIVLDIDNFKYVNDTYGHMFGDEVLLKVTEIINENIVGRGIVGRIGGDEFMIVIDRQCAHSDLRAILRGIRTTVEYVFGPGCSGTPYNVTVTMGACEFGNNIKTYKECFKVADMMLYYGKEKGRNRYIIYEPEIHGDVLSLDSIEDIDRVDNVGQTKDQLMLSLISLFMEKKTMSYSVATQSVMGVFGLDEVTVYKDNFDKPKYFSSKGREEITDDISFAFSESFEHFYKDGSVAVINHPTDVKDICPECYDYLVATGFEGIICYKGSASSSVIIFGRKSKRLRKWSDMDISYLTFIGSMFDIELDNR